MKNDPKLAKDPKKDEILAALYRKVRKYHLHLYFYAVGNHLLAINRKLLTSRRNICTQDYATEYDSGLVAFKMLPIEVESAGGFKRRIVCLFRGKCDCEASMIIWFTLLRMDAFAGVDMITLSSDCGSHLRGWLYLAFLTLVEETFAKKIDYLYRSPRHGTGPQDAVANTAMAVTESGIKAGRLTTLEALAAVMRKKMTNTTVYNFGDLRKMGNPDLCFAQKPKLPPMTASAQLPGLKACTYFQPVERGLIRGRCSGGSGPWIYWKLFTTAIWCSFCTRATGELVYPHLESESDDDKNPDSEEENKKGEKKKKKKKKSERKCPSRGLPNSTLGDPYGNNAFSVFCL